MNTMSVSIIRVRATKKLYLLGKQYCLYCSALFDYTATTISRIHYLSTPSSDEHWILSLLIQLTTIQSTVFTRSPLPFLGASFFMPFIGACFRFQNIRTFPDLETMIEIQRHLSIKLWWLVPKESQSLLHG